MFRIMLPLIGLAAAGAWFATRTGPVDTPPSVADLERVPVTFDEDSPRSEKGTPAGWVVFWAGKYEYDRDWTFKELRLETAYTSRAGTRVGPGYKISDEAALGSPGRFRGEFRLAAPADDEALAVRAVLVIGKAGRPDREWSTSKVVSAPPQ